MVSLELHSRVTREPVRMSVLGGVVVMDEMTGAIESRGRRKRERERERERERGIKDTCKQVHCTYFLVSLN